MTDEKELSLEEQVAELKDTNDKLWKVIDRLDRLVHDLYKQIDRLADEIQSLVEIP